MIGLALDGVFLAAGVVVGYLLGQRLAWRRAARRRALAALDEALAPYTVRDRDIEALIRGTVWQDRR